MRTLTVRRRPKATLLVTAAPRVGVVTALSALTALLALTAAPALAGTCKNEQFRTGRSASLPDCRAYELVTPPELGRTADMLFESNEDKARVSSDGDRIALEAHGAYLEPAVSNYGTQAVFSRTPAGWAMESVPSSGMAGEGINLQLFSPDLSQVAFQSFSQLALTEGRESGKAFEVGPVGGPYSTLASVPAVGDETQVGTFVGANAGTASVPAFSTVVLVSADHALLPRGAEREVAEKTEPGGDDLYEWAGGRLRLVNVDNEGKLLNPCGAELGFELEPGDAIGAISADGSKIFFTSCKSVLYMRVDNGETVEVSAAQGVSEPAPSLVKYDGASEDGSKVFFTTTSDLTPAAEVESSGTKLYEYDTEAPVGSRLTLIASGIATVPQFINPEVVVSEDGSAVYYLAGPGMFRYETATGRNSFVAVTWETKVEKEPSYATPDGDFLLFASGSSVAPGPVEFLGPNGRLEEESRGAGHDELYRYDAVDGSVMCVSCGEGVAPAKGDVRESEGEVMLQSSDGLMTALSMSDDGRRVFFSTNAQLVAQDRNETSVEEAKRAVLGSGADVYEWEADGTEEEPGVFCGVANGCTHLISAGEDVGPEYFLGTSSSGDDVFFTSAAELAPEATPEFTNIYDARVDGGFPSPPPVVECTSCQGVGSPPPLFGLPAGVSFEGAGNPAVPALVSSSTSPKPKARPKPKAKRCKQGLVKRGGRCVKRPAARGKKATRSAHKATRSHR